jgi:hypothetical protein
VEAEAAASSMIVKKDGSCRLLCGIEDGPMLRAFEAAFRFWAFLADENKNVGKEHYNFQFNTGVSRQDHHSSRDDQNPVLRSALERACDT